MGGLQYDMSSNPYIPWTLELFNAIDTIPTHGLALEALCEIESFPWSIDLIDRYEYAAFGSLSGAWRLLSKRTDLPWTLEAIRRWRYRWDFTNLGQNEKVQMPALREEDVDLILGKCANPSQQDWFVPPPNLDMSNWKVYPSKK